MIKLKLLMFAGVLLALWLAGPAAAQLYEPTAAIPARGTNAAPLIDMLKEAAQADGWSLRAEREGLLVVFKTNRRGESSTVKIPHDASQYAIRSVSTASNDKEYRALVQGLEQAINSRLGVSGSAVAPAGTSGFGKFMTAVGNVSKGVVNQVAQEAAGTTVFCASSAPQTASTTASAPQSTGTPPETVVVVEQPPPFNGEWDPKETAALLPVSVNAAQQANADGLFTIVENMLNNTGYFVMVDQSRLQEYLETNQLQASDLFQNNAAAQGAGEFLGAQIIVAAKLAPLDRGYTLGIKLVDVRTSQILCSAVVPNRPGDTLTATAENASAQLARKYYKLKTAAVAAPQASATAGTAVENPVAPTDPQTTGVVNP